MRTPDRRLLGALALVPALAGSAAAQPAPPAAAPAPPPPAGAAAPRTPSERLDFAAAIERALAHNPSAIVASQEIARAEALVREARATSLPSLTANGTYTRLDADRVLGDRVVAPRDALNANLTLAVPLLAPQRWAHWSRAKDAASLQKVSAADVSRTVAAATGRAYLNVVSQHRAVEVAERARATAEAHADFARSRFQGGVGNRIDLVRAEQEVATAVTQLEAAHVALARATEALGVLVGAEGAVDAVGEPALDQAPPLATSLDRVRTDRADVKAAGERVRTAQRSVDLGWTDYMPLLVGQFQPFYQNPPSLTQPQTGWQAQLVLSLPLYDGGLRYGQADERAAVLASSRAQLDGLVRQARSEVRSAFESVERADASLAAARDAARLAAEALDLANLAYRAGATTNLEVIDAERRARDAESSAVIAEDSARQARLDLLVASGVAIGKRR